MSVTPETRAAVLRRDLYTCQCQGYYDCMHHPLGAPCGVSYGSFFSFLLHVDHIRPEAEGGSDLDYNLQTLCLWCHQSKTRIDTARMRRNQSL